MSQTQSYELGAEIVALTDQTFERVRRRVEHYALDERRYPEQDGELLLSGAAGSRFYDPANHYGRLTLKICDRQSKANAWKVFYDNMLTPLSKRPEIRDRNFEELNEQVREDKEFRPRASELGIIVVRDRYPRGGMEYDRVTYATSPNHPWMFDKDFDLEDWGDRHKIGVNAEIAFTSESSGLLFRWRVGFILQNRFDRPTPQARLASEVIKLQKQDGEPTELIECGNQRRIDGNPNQMDIDSMKRMIALAKDIRPVVHHPDVNDKRAAAHRALWDRLKNGKPAEEPTST